MCKWSTVVMKSQKRTIHHVSTEVIITAKYRLLHHCSNYPLGLCGTPDWKKLKTKKKQKKKTTIHTEKWKRLCKKSLPKASGCLLKVHTCWNQSRGSTWSSCLHAYGLPATVWILSTLKISTPLPPQCLPPALHSPCVFQGSLSGSHRVQEGIMI